MLIALYRQRYFGRSNLTEPLLGDEARELPRRLHDLLSPAFAA